MKKLFLMLAVLLTAATVNAQNYKETFDTNSLEWTECGFKNRIGTAIIDNGVLTIQSNSRYAKANNNTISSGETIVESNSKWNKICTTFESHCYAPLDVLKPFEIHAKVNIKKLDDDRFVGMVINYRDGGNYYVFSFNDHFVKFIRYENNEVIGEIMQGVKWKKQRRADMDWTLVSDGQTLVFKVDGAALMSIRYMPLVYNGFGFYTFGNQELIVDEVDFIQ